MNARQLTQMKAVFERHFNCVADMLDSRMAVSRGTAPSPTRRNYSTPLVYR